jgi:hypothetical protein
MVARLAGRPAGAHPTHALAVSRLDEQGPGSGGQRGPARTGPLVHATPVCMSGARWRGNIRWVGFWVEDGAAMKRAFLNRAWSGHALGSTSELMVPRPTNKSPLAASGRCLHNPAKRASSRALGLKALSSPLSLSLHYPSFGVRPVAEWSARRVVPSFRCCCCCCCLGCLRAQRRENGRVQWWAIARQTHSRLPASFLALRNRK